MISAELDPCRSSKENLEKLEKYSLMGFWGPAWSHLDHGQYPQGR